VVQTQAQAPRVIVRRGSVLMHWLLTADDPCSSILRSSHLRLSYSAAPGHSILMPVLIQPQPDKPATQKLTARPKQKPRPSPSQVTLAPCMLRARVAASAADLVWQGEAEPLWWEVTWSSRAVLLFQRSGDSGGYKDG
jgi:hypothetical protein